MKSHIMIQETLIVIKNIGVQIEKKSLNGKKTKKFLDCSKIKDLVIHEVYNNQLSKKKITMSTTFPFTIKIYFLFFFFFCCIW